MAITTLTRRQVYYGDGWYYSDTAWIIKWVVTGVIVLVLVGFFGGGYLHARYRMSKGLAPKRWTRWCLTKQQKHRYFPAQYPLYHQTPYGHGAAVPLHSYGPAPPAYHENDYVPPYAPPGATKVSPDQNYQQPEAQPGPSQPSQAAGVYR